MKIELEIPDWAGEQCIRILSGIEMVAYKHTDKNWQVKEIRCARCGNCCSKVMFGDKDCEHLEFRNNLAYCRLGLSMPFHCVTEMLEADKKIVPMCKTLYKEIK